MKDGYIIKSKEESTLKNGELELINKLTRRTFSEDEIYAFTVVLCDNDIDRDFERFSDKSLENLAELYIGKTGVLDHNAMSTNQTARIFSCKVENVNGKKNKLKNDYKRLVARAYMPKSEKNKNIILEIDSGIKKEVSIGCAVENKICSICGKNINEEKCAHKKGKKYKVENSFKVCHIVLDNPTDAYEWSFVAVPAQTEAGVIKAFEISPKGGEENMDEIIKSLNSGENTVLTGEKCKKLFDYIKDLEEKASENDVYRNDLTKSIVKLSKLVQSEFSEEIINSVTDKLPMNSLQAIQKALQTKASKIFPASPQLSPEKLDPQEPKNTQFKI